MKLVMDTFQILAMMMLTSSSSIIGCPTCVGHRLNGTKPMMVKNKEGKKEPSWKKNLTAKAQTTGTSDNSNGGKQ